MLLMYVRALCRSDYIGSAIAVAGVLIMLYYPR